MKGFLVSIFLIAGLVGVFLLLLIPLKREKGPGFRRLAWDEIDISGGFQDRELILKGLSKSIHILEDMKHAENFTIQGTGASISRRAILLSLERLQDIFREETPSGTVIKKIREDFTPYEIQTGRERKVMPVLVTGYFQPSFMGSYKATADYSCPVYGWPPDLIKINLRQFDQALPARILWGRVLNRQVVPYYSRREIEEKRPFPGELALCWLNSTVDVLELQIQGSGIIRFGDGSSRFIHYASSNGLGYRSIGKILKERGLIEPGRLNWPGIKAWAGTHPEEFGKILSENPRYIFFKWEERGPVGSFGQVLVPGTSTALDSSLYPPGIPGMLLIKWPGGIRSGPEWFRNNQGTLLVFNHDRGSAIKGLHRLDLYCGSGDRAGMLAGRLKSRARLIILLHRDVSPET